MLSALMDNEHNSQDVSDDSIRHFLLGQLPASEQTLFEEELFTNADLEGRLRLAEFDLADDYAFKRLTESETKAFRERYLLTADRLPTCPEDYRPEPRHPVVYPD